MFHMWFMWHFITGQQFLATKFQSCDSVLASVNSTRKSANFETVDDNTDISEWNLQQRERTTLKIPTAWIVSAHADEFLTILVTMDLLSIFIFARSGIFQYRILKLFDNKHENLYLLLILKELLEILFLLKWTSVTLLFLKYFTCIQTCHLIMSCILIKLYISTIMNFLRRLVDNWIFYLGL